MGWIEADPKLDLVASVGRGDGWGGLEEAEVCLDVTCAGNGAEHGRRILELGLRPVVGTSGVSPAEAASLHDLAISLGLGGAVVPNFSLGMLALSLAANAAKGALPSGAIVEAHHPEKLDAPSGTAIHLASQLDLELGAVTSVRMAGLTAIHEVRYWGGQDSITLRHESRGLGGFQEGLLTSIRYAANARGVAYGLAEVVGETCKLQS
jgi:4-hydroxy-tetrahydrodipicolinate reductase